MKRLIATFHKCGSNWIRAIFAEIAALRGHNWSVLPYAPSPLNEPATRGGADDIVVIRGGAPDAIADLGAGPDDPRLLAIRDPRDALVSQYWSWKASHQNNGTEILAAREIFAAIPRSEALHWLVDNRKLVMARQMRRVPPAFRAGAGILRYEDLLADFAGALRTAFNRLRLEVSPGELASIEAACRFEAKTGGRKPGMADPSHHLRNGQAGVWAADFDDALKQAFKREYGWLLADLGYERDNDW